MFLEFRHQKKYLRPPIAIMKRTVLLLLATIALALALPRRHKLAVRVVTEGGLEGSTTVSSVSDGTEKPENKVITVKNLQEFSTKVSEAGDKLVVVFIMGNSCPLSQWIAPIVDQVAKENNDIVVLKVDVVDPSTEYGTIVKMYNAAVKKDDGDKYYIPLPTFVFVKGGTKMGLVARPETTDLKGIVAGYAASSTTTVTPKETL